MPKKLTPEIVENAPAVTPRDIMDKDILLQELAQLDLITYDQRREEFAGLLRCRVQSLDQEVKRRRPRSQDDNDTFQGEAIHTLDVTPWENTVDGPDLVQAIVNLISAYIVLSQEYALAVALWILYTYIYDLFYVSPRLHITSPQKRCGKSYLVTLIALLAHRAVTTSNITTASLFRLIAQSQVTVVMDEADTFVLGNEDLRGVLNAGHTKETAYVLRTVGDDHEVRRFPVWAPIVIAGIGRIPDTVQDRAITLALKRKKTNESRKDLLRALRKQQVQPMANELRRKCLRWAQDHMDILRDSDPNIPMGVHDRDANNWEPLLAIADAIGDMWPEKARKTIKTLAGQNDAQDTTPAILLLQDMKMIFQRKETDRLASKVLVEELHQMEDRPWAEYGKQRKPISTNQVASLLKPFDVKPKGVRDGGDVYKGYLLENCQDAFDRYLQALSVSDEDDLEDSLDNPSQTVTPLQPNNHAVVPNSPTVTLEKRVTDKNPQKPKPDNDCNGVTDRMGELWRDEI